MSDQELAARFKDWFNLPVNVEAEVVKQVIQEAAKAYFEARARKMTRYP